MTSIPDPTDCMYDDDTIDKVAASLQEAIGQTAGVMLDGNDARAFLRRLWHHDLAVIEDDHEPEQFEPVFEQPRNGPNININLDATNVTPKHLSDLLNTIRNTN